MSRLTKQVSSPQLRLQPDRPVCSHSTSELPDLEDMTAKFVAVSGRPSNALAKQLSSIPLQRLVVSTHNPKLTLWLQNWADLRNVPLEVVRRDKRHGKRGGKYVNEIMSWYADTLVVSWDCKPGETTDIIRRFVAQRKNVIFSLVQ